MDLFGLIRHQHLDVGGAMLKTWPSRAQNASRKESGKDTAEQLAPLPNSVQHFRVCN
jgi:hypothetical protein